MTDFVGDGTRECITHHACDCIQAHMERCDAERLVSERERTKLVADLHRSEARLAWCLAGLELIRKGQVADPVAEAARVLQWNDIDKRHIEKLLSLEAGSLD